MGGSEETMVDGVNDETKNTDVYKQGGIGDYGIDDAGIRHGGNYVVTIRPHKEVLCRWV